MRAEAEWPEEGDPPALLRELTDVREAFRRQERRLRRKASQTIVAAWRTTCLRCGHVEGPVDSTRGLCAGCNPVTEPWRKWRPSDGPPPYYHPPE